MLTRLPVLVLLLALAGACVPESENPLSDPIAAKADPRLAGHWIGRLRDSKVDSHLHFVPREGGLAEVLLVAEAPADDPTDGGWAAYRFFPSHLGGRDYLNLRLLAMDGEAAGPDGDAYLLCRYAIDGQGRLTVWRLSPDPARAAVEAGAVAGRVEKQRFGADVVLTAATSDLAAFVAKADAEALFATHVGTFARAAGR